MKRQYRWRPAFLQALGPPGTKLRAGPKPAPIPGLKCHREFLLPGGGTCTAGHRFCFFVGRAIASDWPGRQAFCTLLAAHLSLAPDQSFVETSLTPSGLPPCRHLKRSLGWARLGWPDPGLVFCLALDQRAAPASSSSCRCCWDQQQPAARLGQRCFRVAPFCD
jgi:hypothetical protein